MVVSNPFTDPNWAERTVDAIDRWVSTIRRYTTQPVITVARGLVFGLLAVFGAVTALVLLLIGLPRGLQGALDAVVDRDAAVWISYFVVSGLFALAGVALMRKRHSPPDRSTK